MRRRSAELTSTAVVRALGAGEAALRPAVRGAVHVEQGVLLLDTEPRLEVLGLVHGLLRVVAEVGAIGGAVAVVALGEDEDVVAAAEGILEDGGGTEVNIGVVARSLVGGGAIEVPDAEGTDIGDLLVDGLKAG